METTHQRQDNLACATVQGGPKVNRILTLKHDQSLAWEEMVKKDPCK